MINRLPRTACLLLVLVLSGPASASEIRDYQNARALFDQGLFLMATRELEDFLDEYPDGEYAVDAAYLLGECLYRRGDYRAARDHFEDVSWSLQRTELAASAAVRLAECELNLGNNKAVLSAYDHFQKWFPDSDLRGRFLLLAGLAHRYQGENEAALELFETLASEAEEEERGTALFYTGLTALALGDFDKALDYLNLTYRHDPDGRYSQEALYYETEALLRQENYDRVIDSVERFVQAHPQGARAGDMLLRAAEAHANLGQRDEAREVYCALLGDASPALCRPADGVPAIGAMDNLTRAYAFLGLGSVVTDDLALSVYANLADWAGTIEVTEELSPGFFAAQARLESARIHMRRENWTAALEILEEALADEPPAEVLPQLLLERAQCALALDQYADAEEDSRRVVEEYPGRDNSLNAHLLLARSLAAQDRIDEASQTFARVLKAKDGEDSGDPEAMARLAYQFGAFLFGQDRWAGSLPHFARAAEAEGVSPELRVDALRARGEALYQLGRFEEAASVYRDALATLEERSDQSSEAARIQLSLGWALHEQDKHEDAAGTFARAAALARNPLDRLEALYMEGESRLELQELDQAQELYDTVAAASPAADYGRMALYRTAWVEYRRENWTEAVAGFGRFLAAEPEEGEQAADLVDDARFHRAWALLQADRGPEAERDFVAFARNARDSEYAPRAWISAGDSAYNRGDYDQAVEYYQEAVSRYPDHEQAPGSLHAIGWAHTAAGEVEKALRAWEELAERYPQSPLALEGLYSLGETHFRRGEYDAAAEAFEDLIEQSPADNATEARYWLGRSRLEQGRFTEAADVLARHSRDFPESDRHADALYWAGRAHQEAGQDATATVFFHRLVDEENNPGNSLVTGEALLALARNLEEEQKPREALLYYQRLADLESALADTRRLALKKLGDLRRELGEPERSLAPYRMLIAQEKEDDLEIEAQYNLGLALFSMGRYEEAVSELLRVPNLYGPRNPWAASAFAQAGKGLEKMERWTEAVQVYEECLGLDPDPGLREEVAERLNWIRDNEAILDLELPEVSTTSGDPSP